MGPVLCAYCNQVAELVTGEVIYPHRPDLFRKFFYRCVKDEAYVGCHEGKSPYGTGKMPLGRLANDALRKAKSRAHAAFDPLWKGRHMKRREAYQWLAAQLGIHPVDCHIGMFDLEQCQRVVEAVRRREVESV